MVFVAVIGLIDIRELVRWARISPVDFWIALASPSIGLTAGLLAAVAVGVVLTLCWCSRELNNPKLTIAERAAVADPPRPGAVHGERAGERTRNHRVADRERPVRAVVLDLSDSRRSRSPFSTR